MEIRKENGKLLILVRVSAEVGEGVHKRVLINRVSINYYTT